MKPYALPLCLLLLVAAGGAFAGQKQVDYLGLAALMVRDGHYERAAQALESVDTAREGFDFIRYYTLKGLTELKLERYADAVESLEKAIRHGQQDTQVYLHLARAAWHDGQYRKGLDALQRGGDELLLSAPGVVLLKSQLHWKLGDKPAAWEALQFGERQFSDGAPFMRRKVFMLVELGLYQEASRLGLTYMERYRPGPDDYVAIGEALRQAGQAISSLNFLELGKVKYPDNQRILLALAKVYADLGRYYTAAGMMERAAALGGDYLIDAAELYRRAGHPGRALFLNERALDQKKKLKQRLAILLDMGMFEQAEGMSEALYRHGLLKDDQIRYAVAYAAFKAGHFEAAAGHLTAITTPSLFRKATALRKAMSVCGEERWQCL